MAARPRESPSARILSGLTSGDGSGDLVGGLGYAVLGLLVVALAILELMVALGCCYGVVVPVGLREDSGGCRCVWLEEERS